MCHRNPAKLADDAGPSKSITRQLHIKGINKLNDTQPLSLYQSDSTFPIFATPLNPSSRSSSSTSGKDFLKAPSRTIWTFSSESLYELARYCSRKAEIKCFAFSVLDFEIFFISSFGSSMGMRAFEKSSKSPLFTSSMGSVS